jgi:hypothetical protein
MMGSIGNKGHLEVKVARVTGGSMGSGRRIHNSEELDINVWLYI